MMRLQLLILAALTLAFGLIGLSCGGGSGDSTGPTATVDVSADDGDKAKPTATIGDGGNGSSTLAEYFQQLDEAENTFHAAGDAADAQLSALDESKLDDAPGIFQEVKAAIDAFVAALEEMDPPDEAVTPHQETIAGFQAASDLIERSLPEVEAAQTLNDVSAPLTSPEFTEISNALDATCVALQSIANSNGIAVDLSCDVGG
jgi:hypothetical protein